MKRILSLLLLSFLVNSMQAQFYKKYEEVGDQLMAKGDYAGAVKNYQLGMKLDSGSASLRYSYAQALRMTNNYKKAAFYFESVRKYDSRRQFQLSYHYAGEMYKYLGRYKESLKQHKRFSKSYRGDKSKYEFKKSKHEVENFREVVHLLRDTASLELSNDHEVNTAFSEFGAYLENDTFMLYSTLTSDSLKKRLVLDSTTYFARIHRAEKIIKWEPLGPHPAFHEDEMLHIANPTLSPKSEYVYYNECKGKKCTILRARNNQGIWTDFEELPEPINLPPYTSSQPILVRSNGYDLLFFSSDRPGGYGKMDIWYTIAYSNGLFEDPINLGKTINTPGNEICPFFFEEEEALYFSSDYHMGLGGFDIFRSVLQGELYTEVENLGLPLNSSYNDLYFRHSAGQAVITSNRKGSKTDRFENCCNDLFFFDYKAKVIPPNIELSALDKIERLLPLRLYFHNDEPNPRSRDTSTSVLYSASYVSYMGKLPTYEREYSRGLKGLKKEDAKEEINLFFEGEVKLGYNDLKEGLELLNQELDNGQKIELVIKGYASPLSQADYNRRLTLRRISCLINEIEYFNGGSLKDYMDSGSLLINKIPFGEDRLSGQVSDNVNDKRNAIYSKQASYERRVEIIAIRKVN